VWDQITGRTTLFRKRLKCPMINTEKGGSWRIRKDPRIKSSGTNWRLRINFEEKTGGGGTGRKIGRKKKSVSKGDNAVRAKKVKVGRTRTVDDKKRQRPAKAADGKKPTQG